jgi:hypothetical protein
MTSLELKLAIERISKMETLCQKIRQGLEDPDQVDPDKIEYDLNRIKTAIYNFKQVQLPKLKTNEKEPFNPTATRPGHVPYHSRRKPKPAHG